MEENDRQDAQQDSVETVGNAFMRSEQDAVELETAAPAEPESAASEMQKNAKERLYDKIPLTVTHLNIIIAVLIVALIVTLVIGTLRGNGII